MSLCAAHIGHKLSSAEAQAVHNAFLFLLQLGDLHAEGAIETLEFLAQAVEIVQTHLKSGRLENGFPVAEHSLCIGREYHVILLIELVRVIALETVFQGGHFSFQLHQLIDGALLDLGGTHLRIKHGGIGGVGRIVLELLVHLVHTDLGRLMLLLHLLLYQIEHIAHGIGVDASAGSGEHRLDVEGLDGRSLDIGRIKEHGLGLGLGKAVGLLLDLCLIGPQVGELYRACTACAAVILIIDDLLVAFHSRLLAADGRKAGEGGEDLRENIVKERVRLLRGRDAYIAHGSQLPLDVLTKAVLIVVQSGHIDRPSVRLFISGKSSLLLELFKFFFIFFVILRPVGGFTAAADPFHGPGIGHIVCDLLIGVAQDGRADAAEAVAAQILRIGKLLDDIVLHREGAGLHSADILLIEALCGKGLVLFQGLHALLLIVHPIQEEAEVKGQSAQAFGVVVCGGHIHMDIPEAAQLPAHAAEAGGIHHESVDLLDGGIAVSAQALTLGLSADGAAVHHARQEQEATDES